MKLAKILSIAFLAISMVACKPSTEKKEETTTTTHQAANLVTSNIGIEGMTCQIGCAKTIESKISKLEGVTESKVDFETKQGTFTYDSNITSEEKIINNINGLLDGKTYKANHQESCKAGSEKACCQKEKKTCSKPCAEKCGHKEGESCKTGEKPCAKADKKECAKKCDSKEETTCKTEKKECKAESEKACCAAH